MTGVWRPAPGVHAAQLYRSDRVLHGSVAHFFADAVRAGEPAVMIARPQTYDTVSSRLCELTESAPADVAARLMFVDVAGALDQFMDGSTVHAAAAEDAFSTLLATMRGSTVNRTIWIYGEMVDVLSRRRNHEAAIRLEQIWNERFACPTVSIMCGYSLESFDSDVRGRMLRRVCREHTHIIPSARFSDAAAIVSASVYIVDDDPSVSRSLQRLLSLNGWNVRAFPSAEAFLAEVAPSSVGCLVLDMGLGGMSGLDLQRWMARANWRMPVVAISGAHDALAEAQALRLGAAAFLAKPFDSQALVDAITRTLSQPPH